MSSVSEGKPYPVEMCARSAVPWGKGERGPVGAAVSVKAY